MQSLIHLFLIIAGNIFLFSCGIYSFTGASIPTEAKTISVQYFNNKAATIQPTLSQVFTERLKDIFVENTNLTFKENEVKEIAQKAITKKTGARGLRSILENILLKTMFELPGQEDIDEVVIDLGAAKGQNDPLIIHSKDAKNKSEKTSAA